MAKIGRGHRLQRANFATLKRLAPRRYHIQFGGFLSEQQRARLRREWEKLWRSEMRLADRQVVECE